MSVKELEAFWAYMVIIVVVRGEVKRNVLLVNKLRNEMFNIKKDVKVLDKRIEMQLMMINSDYNEDVLLNDYSFKRNYSRVYDAKVVPCVKEELEWFYHQSGVQRHF